MKKLAKILTVGVTAIALGATFALTACAPADDGDDGENVSVFRNTYISADDSYSQPCDQKGNVQLVTYDTRAYAVENYLDEQDGSQEHVIEIQKSMYVYTPFGYDTAKQYNVLFLMHGGGEDIGYWFGEGDYEPLKNDTTKFGKIGNITQNIADNLIKDGTIDPLIIVCPTYTSEVDELDVNELEGFGEQSAPFYFEHFWKEFRYDLMPYIQEHYATYVEENTEAAFKAARDHFGFIGFSMGSRCTYQTIWNHNLDYVSYIGNLSEGTDKVDEIVEKLTTGEYKDLDVKFYYASCGQFDFAKDAAKKAYEEMTAALPAKLNVGDDISKGNNAWFNTNSNGTHEYWCWVVDYYNCLQVFFK